MMWRSPSRSICVSSVPTKDWRHRAWRRRSPDSGMQSWKRRRIVADCGECWEKTGFFSKNVEYFSLARTKPKKSKGSWEREAGRFQGQWQQESPVKEFLEQVKSSADTDCTSKMMRCGYFALKDGDWEEHKTIFKVEVSATEWAFERIRETFGKVAKDEAGSLNIVQGTMLRSTDFVRRIIASAGGQGGVTLSYLCPQCNSFPLKDYIWWVSAWKKHCSWRCAICGERYEWKAPNRLLVVQTGVSAICVNIWSMRSSCWRTSRNMEIAQSRVL